MSRRDREEALGPPPRGRELATQLGGSFPNPPDQDVRRDETTLVVPLSTRVSSEEDAPCRGRHEQLRQDDRIKEVHVGSTYKIRTARPGRTGRRLTVS